MKVIVATILWAILLSVSVIIVLLAVQARYIWCHTAKLCLKSSFTSGQNIFDHLTKTPWATGIHIILVGHNWKGVYASLNSVMTQNIKLSGISILIKRKHDSGIPKWSKNSKLRRTVHVYPPQTSLFKALQSITPLNSLVFLIPSNAVIPSDAASNVWRSHTGAPYTCLGFCGAVKFPKSLKYEDAEWKHAGYHMQRVGLLTTFQGIAFRLSWLQQKEALNHIKQAPTKIGAELDERINLAFSISNIPRAMVSAPKDSNSLKGAFFKRLSAKGNKGTSLLAQNKKIWENENII